MIRKKVKHIKDMIGYKTNKKIEIEIKIKTSDKKVKKGFIVL